MAARRTQREMGEEAGFMNAESQFLEFIAEECSPQKAAEAILYLNLEKRELLEVDSQWFDMADKLRKDHDNSKPSYNIAPKEPFNDERRGYLLGCTDMLIMMYHNKAGDHIDSVIDSMGILRRDLLHAGADEEDIDQLDDLLASKPDSVYWGHE